MEYILNRIEIRRTWRYDMHFCFDLLKGFHCNFTCLTRAIIHYKYTPAAMFQSCPRKCYSEMIFTKLRKKWTIHFRVRHSQHNSFPICNSNHHMNSSSACKFLRTFCCNLQSLALLSPNSRLRGHCCIEGVIFVYK